MASPELCHRRLLAKGTELEGRGRLGREKIR